MFVIDGKLLKSIRKELGYKKTDMCNYVGISLTAMTNIESGISTPKEENKKKICKFLKKQGYSGDLDVLSV